MTKARIKCKECKEWFQYNIQKEKIICPVCGFTQPISDRIGFFRKKNDYQIFRETKG